MSVMGLVSRGRLAGCQSMLPGRRNRHCELSSKRRSITMSHTNLLASPLVALVVGVVLCRAGCFLGVGCAVSLWLLCVSMGV